MNEQIWSDLFNLYSLELVIYLLGDAPALLRVEAEHDDPGAPTRQLLRGLVAHARVAARHQCSFPVQPTIGLNREDGIGILFIEIEVVLFKIFPYYLRR